MGCGLYIIRCWARRVRGGRGIYCLLGGGPDWLRLREVYGDFCPVGVSAVIIVIISIVKHLIVN